MFASTTSANSYQASSHVINSSTIAYVQLDLSVTQINLIPSPQHASRATKDEQEGGPECQLLPVHSGRRAVPHPRRVCPLFPCSQGLLEGPAPENEGLWHQHPHYVGKLPWMCFASQARSTFWIWTNSVISLQVCAVESAPTRERGFQLPHAAGFRVRGTKCKSPCS